MANINKKRNTIFLYEILIKEMTQAVIAEDKEKKDFILSLLKEAFRPGTELYKEWASYRALLGFRTNKPIASRIFNKVMDNYKIIDQEKLAAEQGRLIKRINKAFKPTIFQHFVPNYKSLASIYQLFHSKLPIQKRVLLEEQVISNISHEEVLGEEKKEVYQPISRLAYKTFVEKFNEKYKVLLPEQRELLSKFALADERQVELKVFLNEEIGRLKSIVGKSLLLEDVKSDNEMVEKTKEVVAILESFSQREVDQEMIEQVMKVQQLAKEIEEE